MQYVTRSFGKGDGLIVVENIPYLFCPRCGERYFTAATLREIERIKVERRPPDSTKADTRRIVRRRVSLVQPGG